jgi:transposase
MTLLRLVRALAAPPVDTPRELGVDEFAFRRGRRYGTILIDAYSHHVIDSLEDPSADALVKWLDNHPGVKVICRDRDGVRQRRDPWSTGRHAGGRSPAHHPQPG